MPAISLNTLQDILPKEKQLGIYDSVFGAKPSASESASSLRDQSFQDWINSRKHAIEQQRTDDVRMARLNALGNVLTTMVQPIGWAIGGKGTGVTGGVQPVDNRQYLQAFERAVKANDDLRNIGTLEGEYQFKLADDAYRRAQALEDYGMKQNMELERQAAYAKQRHDYTMAEIEARGETQKELARFKASNSITNRNRVPVEEKMLSSAWTRYMSEREKYNTDVDRGIVRKRESFPSFEKWLGDEYGWIVKPKNQSSDTTEKPDGEDFSSYRRNGNAGGNGSGEDFSQYKRRK